MPLEQPRADLGGYVSQLAKDFADAPAEDILKQALFDPILSPVALVSSFGAESIVLLHMASRIQPRVPVLFLETGMLFPETLAYQQDVARKLDLQDLRVIKPARSEIFAHDPDGILHLAEPDRCCAIRKVAPMASAMLGFQSAITGRKRYHGRERANIEAFEVKYENISINPLVTWTGKDLSAYIDRHNLPRHPLVSKGFSSIGCAPCTTPIEEGESPRAGRWRKFGKTECGIHFPTNGKVERTDYASIGK